MFKTVALGSLVLGLAAAAPAAVAATAVVNVSLNVADVEPGKNGFTGGVQDSPPFGPAFNVSLAVGDSFDLTIDFVGNQTLTIQNLGSIWAFSYADQVSQVTGTGSLSLLDAQGVALYTSITKTTTEGDVHFGQDFSAADFAGLPTSITIGGLRYVGTVDAYDAPVLVSRQYTSPALYFNAGSFVASVPEPASWLMMAAGLGLALAARRRRAQV